MNVLGDFIKRVESLYPMDIDNEELNALLTTIKNQGGEIDELNKEVEKLQAKLEKEKSVEKPVKAKETVATKAKAPSAKKKPAAKKTTKKEAAK